MKKSNEIVCFPIKDNTKRFLIGKKGQYEMLAIALNPSVANENKLDPTSKNIELIANNNGCDGWWLVNLYPKRMSNPCLLYTSPSPRDKRQARMPSSA